jgi:hypothetical protein
MRAEQVGESGRLCLAQLRELRSDVRYRAVVLAQLRTSTDMLSRRSVTLCTQGDRQQLGPGDRVGRSSHLGPVLINQVYHSAFGERTDCLLAVALSQKAQCVHRQIVIGVLEPRPASVGEQE